MFDLYPNILQIHQQNVEPAKIITFSICKSVENKSGQKILIENGEEYTFKYVVYMPAGTIPIDEGTYIRISHLDEIVTDGVVKGFVSSPFGCKLWI